MKPLFTRVELANAIASRLESEKTALSAMYEESEPEIGYFILDDLLPHNQAEAIAARFPDRGLKFNNTLRERKLISAQMNAHDPLIEEAVFAFQDARVLKLMGEICRHPNMFPDEHLYAGGISTMRQGHFLNPHLDNSHDKDRQRWRVFNVLYYVTPGWCEADGGNLELWPDGIGGKRIVIPSQFNRVVVMATHESSWHSVNPVVSDGARRCISNYYFSDEPLRPTNKFHVTSFRGRPEQKLVDTLLRADAVARSAIRKVIPSGVGPQDHVYRK